MRTIRPTFLWLVAVLTTVALLVAACDSGDTGDSASTTIAPDTTTTTLADATDEPVVFGSGELPATVPEDFPLPAQAVVGTTLIDRINDVTEVSLTYPATVVAVVDFFEANLVAVGYTIEDSSGSDGDWEIAFSHADGPQGTIRVVASGSGVSQGAIRFVATS